MMNLPVADAVFSGALQLFQPPKGHRAGTDGVLLAAATPPEAMTIADLGASTGLVGLRAAQLNPEARIHLFEREADLCRLAAANIAANGLSSRVEMSECDILAPRALSRFREHFQCVLSNPPFHEAGRTRMSQAKSAAYVMNPTGSEAGLETWIKRATSILAPKGKLALVHRADQVNALLAAFEGRYGSIRLIFVHPKADQPAIRVLIGGIKGSRAPLTILPPLVLHETDGQFTAVAQGLNRSEARLPLFSSS